MKLSKNGAQIATVDQWFEAAPPKRGALHWKPGRSARELAVAWCGRGSVCVPDDVRAAVEGHPDIGRLDFIEGEPEKQIRFDRFAGEPRNADLALLARGSSGLVAITVEAKADETFGEFVEQARGKAFKRKGANPASNATLRIEQLVAALLSPNQDGMPATDGIRYQLLTATAGTLEWARLSGARKAVLLIHEFTGRGTKPGKVAANGRDLDAFVSRISGGRFPRVDPARISGPIAVPGAPIFDDPAELYVGKVSLQLGDEPN